MRGAISFWADGVTCFCHEAVARLLHHHFPDVTILPTDLALQKYESIDNDKLTKSAWAEYLRNGPRYRFEVDTSIAGYFSRYEIAFDEPITANDKRRIRDFFDDLKPTEICVEDA